MTEAEVETLVLETVRRYTAKDAVAPGSDFEADLRLSAAARQMLFASLAQAFSARGLSLPSHGFLQRDFLACPTPAAVRDAIRAKVFGAAAAPAKRAAGPASPAGAKAAGAGRPHKAKAPTKRAVAPKKAAKAKGAKAKKRR